MEKKKKTIIIVIAVVVLLIASVALYYTFRRKDNKSSSGSILDDIYTDLTNVSEENIAAAEEPFETGNYTLQEQITLYNVGTGDELKLYCEQHGCEIGTINFPLLCNNSVQFPLKNGSKGFEIGMLQAALNEKEFSNPLKVDCWFGNDTLNKLKRVAGVSQVDENTYKRLIS